MGVGINPVSDDEHSVSSVGSPNGTSWYKHRLDIISVGFEVTADAFEGEGAPVFVSVNGIFLVEQSGRSCHLRNTALFHHREDAANVLTNDPIGPDLTDAAVHVRPEVAVIRLASSLSGDTERLARKSACEHVDASLPFGEVCLRDVFIRFAVWVPVVEHGASEGVDLAVEQVLPSQHACSHLRAADAAEY
jgi:hypothetical protein